MRKRTPQGLLHALVAAAGLWAGSAFAQEGGAPVPQGKIDELNSALVAPKDETSAARKRLAVKRMIRDGNELLDAHPTAPNRFEILGLLFRAQKQLFGMDDSPRNREAVLETCRKLAKAPDAYAELRLDADLLLSQTELARRGANAEAHAMALRPLVERYRDTPAEGKMLRVAMVMALELGDARLIKDLREEIAERFAGDLEMISFQREKLGGQVFGAPFCGTFKRSDGTMAHFPADALGRTTALYFWSQGDDGNKDLEELAAKWKEKQEEVAGRLSIVSLNVDELPDAGEKILRDLGVDWPALHLPGGRDNPIYETFAQRDPAIMTLSPTGYAALIMSGATRKLSGTTTGARDYERWFGSSLAREWTKPRYVNRLTSLFVGDFLVVDPEGLFDPTLPPEIKALTEKKPDHPARLSRTPGSVPEETLRAIQDCFPMPPLRYRIPLEEIRSSYQKAEELCAQAIAAHPDAPDLWIVRNRRVIALLGLWKLSADHAYYQRAVEEAKATLDAGMPPGTEVVPQFCLAKETFREPGVDPEKVIGDFVEAMGGEKAPGPAFAAAALLALDVGDRGLHEEYRDIILKRHLDSPMMWAFVSFLLDRYHRYQLFRVPFVAGWSYGRRQDYYLSLGKPEEPRRTVEAGLQTLEGEPFRIPQDSAGKWTVILFTANWGDNKRSPVPGTVKMLATYAESRPFDDLRTVVAFLDDDIESVRTLLNETPLDCQALVVPNGLANPLVRQLGIVSEDEVPNALVLRPDGSIAVALSGLTMQGKARGRVLQNIIEWHDEQAVRAALKQGKIEDAKRIAFALAPPEDPEAEEDPKRKTKKPVFSHAHLRSRARVYMALEDWDAALQDAEEVVKRQTASDGGMSLRTDELDEAEELRDAIRTKRDEAKP